MNFLQKIPQTVLSLTVTEVQIFRWFTFSTFAALLFSAPVSLLYSQTTEEVSDKKTGQFGETTVITITNAMNKKIRITAEVADTDRKRERGLMFRHEMPYSHGMLFVFDEPHHASFWMKNTRIPLSIAYINEIGEIVQIFNMEPEGERIYRSDYKVKYALEVNQGFFAKNMIFPGSMVTFSNP